MKETTRNFLVKYFDWIKEDNKIEKFGVDTIHLDFVGNSWRVKLIDVNEKALLTFMNPMKEEYTQHDLDLMINRTMKLEQK